MQKRIAESANQSSLFDLLTQERDRIPAAPAEGSANIQDRLRRAVSNALKHPLKSRWQIAGEMSHLLGQEISKYQLDGWVAESKEHRLPSEFLPAFCLVTECCEPMKIMAEAAGMFIMPGSEALRAEIQKLDEQARKTQSEKKRRILLLQEMERGAA
jgi:hypothetical protein